MTDLRALHRALRLRPDDAAAQAALTDELYACLGDYVLALMIVSSVVRTARERNYWRHFRNSKARVFYSVKVHRGRHDRSTPPADLRRRPK